MTAAVPPPLDILPHLLRGLGITVEITALAALLALACAVSAGIARSSHDAILRLLAGLYVETFRGTSALVQLFWFYFVLPPLLGIEWSAFTVGVVVLGLNIGAYGAEVVRGAIAAVPRGQREAAAALNLTRGQTVRHIVLPQAIPAMLPPFGNLLIELLKSTALVSMIELTDLTRAGKVLQEGEYLSRAGEVFGMLLVVYFALSQILAAGVAILERRAGRWMRPQEAR